MLKAELLPRVGMLNPINIPTLRLVDNEIRSLPFIKRPKYDVLDVILPELPKTGRDPASLMPFKRSRLLAEMRNRLISFSIQIEYFKKKLISA